MVDNGDVVTACKLVVEWTSSGFASIQQDIGYSPSEWTECRDTVDMCEVLNKPIHPAMLLQALVRVQRKSSQPDAAATHRLHGNLNHTQPHILIAEDITYNRELLQTMLEDIGYAHVRAT